MCQDREAILNLINSRLVSKKNTMATTMWVPKEDGLRQIIALLNESQSPDTNVQREVQQVSTSV